MSRILAETFHSIEDINRILDHPDLKFCDWRCVGRVTPEKGSLSRRDNMPKTKGIYIIAFEYNGRIYPFYGGKTVGKEAGFCQRISCEFYHSQQHTQKDGQSGAFVNNLFAEHGVHDICYYVSVCEIEDQSMIRTYEKDYLLHKFDFIANIESNNELRRPAALLQIIRQDIQEPPVHAPVRTEDVEEPAVRVSPFAEVFKLLAEVDEHIVRISNPTIAEPAVEVEELAVETLLDKVAKAPRSGLVSKSFPETVTGLNHGETVVVSSKQTRTSGFGVPHDHELKRALVFVKADTLLGFYDEDKNLFHINARSLMKHYMKNPDSDAREHVYVERTVNDVTGWRALKYTIA